MDFKNEFVHGLSLVSATRTGNANGVGVDLNNGLAGEVHASMHITTNAGDDTTIDVKLQEADTLNGDYTDISGATFSQVGGDAVGTYHMSSQARAKRYVRAVLTQAGTSDSTVLSVEVLARKQSY